MGTGTKCTLYRNCSLLTPCVQLMGLAVYNSITLDIRFPPCVYKKLLTPPIVPCDLDAPVGMASLTLDDLQQIMPVCTQAVTFSPKCLKLLFCTSDKVARFVPLGFIVFFYFILHKIEMITEMI